VGVKSEIAAAVTLATGLKGQRLSITDFTKQLRLSDAAKEAVSDEVRGAQTLNERFQFDLEEFTKHVAYRTVELDSGGLLSAEAMTFDRVFQRDVIDEPEHKVRYSTEGRVISEKLSRLR
jgi:hypothetical protein